MKKYMRVFTLLFLVLLLSSTLCIFSASAERKTSFKAGFTSMRVGRNTSNEIYSSGYNRAELTFEITTDLSIATGMSQGKSEYTFKWHILSYVGKSIDNDNEFVIVCPVYDSANENLLMLECRYNNATYEATYEITDHTDSLLEDYLDYYMTDVCGEGGFEKNIDYDIKRVLMDFEKESGVAVMY